MCWNIFSWEKKFPDKNSRRSYSDLRIKRKFTILNKLLRIKWLKKTRWKQTVTKYKWETITISGEGEGSVHYIQ